MAAYYCPQCEESYPQHSKFNDCPVCGTSTSYKVARKPDVDMDEGERRKRLNESQAKFEKWCKDNGIDDDPNPPVKVRMQFDGATMADVEYALDLAHALEWNDPELVLGTLYVFRRA